MLPPHTTGIFYTDEVRAKVTSFNPIFSNLVNVDLANIHNTPNPIAIGDKLLIIQMKGGTIGTHEVGEVTAITGNTYTLWSSGAGSFHSYSTSGTDRVQVIKIIEHYDFNLSGGIVTCHNWDDNDGSGGILALVVSNQLTISGGLITVAGKGYTPEEAGITLGVGSNGGASSFTQNLKNAAVAPPNAACLGGIGTVTINQGDKGGVPGSSASSGTANTGTPIYYGGSTKPTLLVMGDPGYYKTGSVAADGGQGGGWGGTGASSGAICGNNGVAGLQGLAGLNGGNAGRGGNGGGAMIIKAKKVVINTTAVVFNASGENGAPGGNGGYGGAGGNGGAGGIGCCNSGTTPIPDGGFGGNGDTGFGGKGGDGGNGGATGYIWIGTTSYTKPIGINRAANFAYYAGKAGRAGFGGWSAINTTGQSLNYPNPCNGNICSFIPPHTCALSVCNPDIAMCELTTRADNGKLVGSSDDVEYFETPTSTTPFAKYISKGGDGDLEVYTYNGCATITTYHAYCKGNCDILFKQIVPLIPPVNVNTNYLVTEKQAISNCSSLPSFPINIKYIDATNGNIPLLEYNHVNINTPATLTDISGGSDNEGVFTSCFSLSGPNDGEEYVHSIYNPPPVQANPGSAGDPGTTPPPPPNSGAGSSVNDNIIIDDGSSWFISANPNISLSNVLNAVAYPNPANKDLHIDLQSEMNTFAFINITDLSGKELVASKQKLQIGNNKIIMEIGMLKAGFYLLNITTNNKSSVMKITIQ